MADIVNVTEILDNVVQPFSDISSFAGTVVLFLADMGRLVVSIITSPLTVELINFLVELVENIDAVIAFIEIIFVGLSLPYINDPIQFIRVFVDYNVKLLSFIGKVVSWFMDKVLDLVGIPLKAYIKS